MFCALRNKLRIRKQKKWDGRQTGGIYLWKANVLRSLDWDQQHAHWCFHNRVWRPKDVKTSGSETVPTEVCGMPHTPVGTVDGRNIQTPSIRYNTPTPKVQCYCNLKCISPSGRKKNKPLTSLLLTRALKHWDLGARGFNIVRAAEFEYFVHLLYLRGWRFHWNHHPQWLYKMLCLGTTQIVTLRTFWPIN